MLICDVRRTVEAHRHRFSSKTLILSTAILIMMPRMCLMVCGWVISMVMNDEWLGFSCVGQVPTICQRQLASIPNTVSTAIIAAHLHRPICHWMRALCVKWTVRPDCWTILAVRIFCLVQQLSASQPLHIAHCIIHSILADQLSQSSCSEDGDSEMDSNNDDLSSNLSSNSNSKRQKRGILPKHATSVMRAWLFQHLVVS